MKTLVRSVLLGFVIIIGNTPDSRAQGWLQVNDFPSSARDDGTSFTINSVAYCGTGLNGSWNPTNDFYSFDLMTESWLPVTGLPTGAARQYANGFASNNQGYIFGGLNTTGFLNDLWRYDPTVDSWTEVTSLPSLGRSGASCFVIGDTAYILGGRTSSSISIAEVWAYSMSSDSWLQKNDLPDSLWRSSAISTQGKGYLLFGLNAQGMYKNQVYEFNPMNDSWSGLSNFPGVGRTYVGLSILNNQIVAIAGRDSIGNSYNDFWKYNLTTNSWSLSTNLPAEQRRGGICFNSTSATYYTTGIDLNNVRLTETWKYDLFLEEDELELNDFIIYPNPTVDLLNILIKHEYLEVEYRIYSAIGQVVQAGKLTASKSIDVRTLATGHYMIELQSTHDKQTKCFIIN